MSFPCRTKTTFGFARQETTATKQPPCENTTNCLESVNQKVETGSVFMTGVVKTRLNKTEGMDEAKMLKMRQAVSKREASSACADSRNNEASPLS